MFTTRYQAMRGLQPLRTRLTPICRIARQRTGGWRPRCFRYLHVRQVSGKLRSTQPIAPRPKEEKTIKFGKSWKMPSYSSAHIDFLSECNWADEESLKNYQSLMGHHACQTPNAKASIIWHRFYETSSPVSWKVAGGISTQIPQSNF